MRWVGLDLEAELGLSLSLYLAVGEELLRVDIGTPRPSVGSDDSRPSCGRGESSDRSYSLDFLRIGGLVRCNGRMGPSPRESPRRGRNDFFADMISVDANRFIKQGVALSATAFLLLEGLLSREGASALWRAAPGILIEMIAGSTLSLPNSCIHQEVETLAESDAGNGAELEERTDSCLGIA
jgi:hypothetical protein